MHDQKLSKAKETAKKMTEGSLSQDNAFHLLKQLEHILEFDTLIDELGFLHPSQFAALNKDGDGSLHPSVDSSSQSADGISVLDANSLLYDCTVFWNKEHKLAISCQAIFPLYNAARHAFMTAIKQYRILLNLSGKKDKFMGETVADNFSVSVDFLESEIMRHSKALLLLSCDFNTAWNSRKLVVSKTQHYLLFLDELKLAALILSHSPKSEHAWSHRRWVIQSIARKHSNHLQEIMERESELVESIAEKSKMNYRAWNHRCWLVIYMTKEQVLDEFNKSRNWAELHVADNCCFHYRRRLMLRMLECDYLKQDISHIWKEELDWNAKLLKLYIGREALWIHRRFLSQFWIKHLAPGVQRASCHTGHQGSANHGMDIYMDNELQFVHSCLNIPDNDFEDGQTQAALAASSILWVSKQIPESLATKLQKKLIKEFGDLKTILDESCPEKRLLWDALMVWFAVFCHN